MIRQVRFDIHHLQVMEIRQLEWEDGLCLPDAAKKVEAMADNSVQAFTFIHDGRVLACAGFLITFPGIIQGWIIPSKYIHTAPVSFARKIKRYVESLAKTFKCHRFETSSYDDDFHHTWMTWLGFEKEGTLRQGTYTKRNLCIYGRLFKWPG